MIGHSLPRIPAQTARRLFWIFGLAVATCAGDSRTASADETVVDQASDAIDFGDSIRPILTDHCLACHGGVKQVAGLTLATRDDALDVIEPGSADDSYLMDRIVSDDPDEVMPPPEHGDALSADQIELMRKWIDQGANWELPWAYESPNRPDADDSPTKTWRRSRIDAFVEVAHTRQGLSHANDAPPQQWLRRVTFDLTGLPPTVEQQDDFLELRERFGDAAYQQWTDRLIMDPGFGERWASVWLDQIRYADSKGMGIDGRRHIWKYRDWVVRAINEDLPFDEFTIKQLAGDLLPDPTIDDIVATAANRLTQTNEEGGTDDEEFRVAAVIDRVSTTWQTWQGITFGCVQCHSHPYDPIKHEEFYEFAAFFNNTSDCDLNEDYPTAQIPIDPSDEALADALDKPIRDLQQRVWKHTATLLRDDTVNWQPIVDLEASANQQTKLTTERTDGETQFATVDTVSRDTTITLRTPLNTIDDLTAIRLTAYPHSSETARTDSEWGFVLSHLDAEIIDIATDDKTPVEFERVIADEPFPFKDPQKSLNKDSNDGFAAYTRINFPRTAVFVVKTSDRPDTDQAPSGERELVVRLSHKVFLNAAFPLVIRRGSLAVTDDAFVGSLLSGADLHDNEMKLSNLKKQRRQIPSVATPVMSERQERLRRPMNVFEGGLFLTKGVEVQPDVPECFPAMPDGVDRNRLTMARWLVSDENPLTSRVIANRVWARLFGQGLVSSEEDFGSSGQRPSHPELLDDLAILFRDDLSWSLKGLVREIVLSSTYRQDATATPDSIENDASNRWLARGPRFRVSAELVRDAALLASGLMTTRVGGPPVHPSIPEGVWKPFHGGDKWDTPDRQNENRYRRSIYTYTKRSIPFPMSAAFDAPSREFCAPRRLRSNTPIQALMTLNDQTFIECADSLSRRMQSEHDQIDEQIHFGFRSVASRAPTENEVARLTQLHEESCQSFGNEQALFDVATVLLNLDEAFAK